MGDITNLIPGGASQGGAGQVDLLGLLTSELMKLVPAGVLEFYNKNMVLCQLGLICAFVLLAIQGYKLFKMAMYAGSAFLFGYLGYTLLAPKVAPLVSGAIPAEIGVKVDVLLAILCALLAVILTRIAYNFMIMILGGALGYYLGSTVVYGALINYFHTLDFLVKFPVVKHIVGGILAAILGILFILLFKHLFMIVTSFGGSIGAGLILQAMVMPTANLAIKIAFAVVGVALGIYAIVRQYREEEKDMEIVF